MNKNLKSLGYLAIALAGTLFSNNASAQFDIESLSFGAGLGYTSHASDIGGSLSYNIRANYAKDEKSSIVIGFNSQLPITRSFTGFASAYNSTTNPPVTAVNVEQRLNFYTVNADFHYYFIEDIEESFGMYGLGGVCLSIANLSYTVSNYDQSLYSFNSGNLQDESFTGFMINLGLGANFNVSDKVALFGEGRIALPANKQNNSTIENPIPFNYCLQAGARFNLFN